MKKIFLTFTFAAVIFAVSYAQGLSVLGGLNMSNMTEKDDDENYSKEEEYKIRLGGHAGLTYTYYFSDLLGLETGVMFNTKGFKLKYEEDAFLGGKSQRTSSEVMKYKIHVNLIYIDIPVLLKYNHELNEKISLIGYAGPALGIAVGGKYKSKVEFMGETEKDSESVRFGNDPEEDDYKRIDFGLMMGAGVLIKDFRIGLIYNQGLINVSPYSENGYISRNRVLSLGVGYNIQLKK